jgi:hypothetical protein
MEENNKIPVLSNGILLRETNYPIDKNILEAIHLQAVEYWTIKYSNMSVIERKSTWPIFDEKFTDLNKYSNGEHSRQQIGRNKLRNVIKKKQ